MAFESDNDRLAMLKACGELVDFTVGQASWPVFGVLDTAYVEVNRVEGYRPTLLCRDLDTTSHPDNAVRHGSTLQTGKGGYQVISIQPDGAGMVLFVLEEIE